MLQALENLDYDLRNLIVEHLDLKRQFCELQKALNQLRKENALLKQQQEQVLIKINELIQKLRENMAGNPDGS